jgi:hypothetical protein
VIKNILAMGIFCASSTLALSGENSHAQDCKPLFHSDFLAEMGHIVSNSELCQGDCETLGAKAGRDVVIKVFNPHLEEAERQRVQNSVEWVVADISSVIGDTVDIDILDEAPETISTRIFIFPMNDLLDIGLIKRGLPGLSADDYVTRHRAALVQDSCSVRTFSSEIDDEERITLTYIFVSNEYVKNVESLDFCLLEELTHSFGLFGDLDGTASFFDNGNVDLSDSRPRNSLKTKAMLRYLYSGTPFDDDSFESYRSALCHK